MNYYIQGDAANADKIKAAFEKLGIDVLDFGFADKTVVYCSIGGCGGCVQCLPYSINLMHILYSHPDYKELELPVEPKFKVGDWIVRGKGFVYEPSLITEIRDYYICELLNGERVTYTLNDVHKNFHLWSIADAKDGDVLVDEDTNTIGIFEKIYGIRWHSKIYCSNSTYNTKVYHQGGSHEIKFTKPATKEQRDLLFTRIREAGYEWDADKKELRKIKPHYDIANFKPFDKVLIRVGNKSKWTCDFFSYYHKGFHCIGTDDWSQCIPFNDDTKHLLGTTDMCPEEYINW